MQKQTDYPVVFVLKIVFQLIFSSSNVGCTCNILPCDIPTRASHVKTGVVFYSATTWPNNRRSLKFCTNQ